MNSDTMNQDLVDEFEYMKDLLAKSGFFDSEEILEILEDEFMRDKEVVVPVIGIDEATDYCLLDFYAINSLRHYEVSSITMTGDGMQCIKENGLFDWKSLADKRLFDKIEVKDLKISYRQSRELLSLAHSLYRKALHKIAPYRSYLETMDNVPKPLWYEADDDEKKAKWIIQRILEIKNNYGFVPSIAIFVTDNKDAQSLFEFLEDNGKLDEAGI